MVYRGPPGRSGFDKARGIKPTEADHEFVRVRWRMGFGVRELCALLGKRYGLEKPLSRMSLYYHHRKDLVPKRGRGVKPTRMSAIAAGKIHTEVGRMIEEIKARKAKR